MTSPLVVQHFPFVQILPGSFNMGSTSYPNEQPPHSVSVSKAFEISRYQVTQRVWKGVMAANPSHFVDAMENPVEMVSWLDTPLFLTRLNGLDRQYQYRLPSEAEWEYAARAGSTSSYYGNPDDMSWYRSNSGDRTHPVGGKLPNTWGLYDVHGNVWEWCHDYFGEGYYAVSPAVDPRGPLNGTERVVRGGAYWSDLARLRVSARGKAPPNVAHQTIGFRCLREQI